MYHIIGERESITKETLIEKLTSWGIENTLAVLKMAERGVRINGQVICQIR